MPADNRSNRCAKCGGTYTSRKHQTQCKGKSIRQFRADNRARYHSRAGTSTHYQAVNWSAALVIGSDYYRHDEPATIEANS